MNKLLKFLDSTFLDLGREFKWTYLPPLMVYMAAGISGLTGIVGTFFVKDYLNLSAAFLAGLGFWAGIPWALKMPLGHLVDLIWKKKNYMVYFGASLIALSLLIMYGLIIHTEDMSEVFSVETWFVISVILAPVGYVVQDVVADAMTVEAVPLSDEQGIDYSKDQVKILVNPSTFPCLARSSPPTVAPRPVEDKMIETPSAPILKTWSAIPGTSSIYGLINIAVTHSKKRRKNIPEFENAYRNPSIRSLRTLFFLSRELAIS